jgi:pyruvate dehydrogenase E2 component (dihydrolipoamide acetyltransferase)
MGDDIVTGATVGAIVAVTMPKWGLAMAEGTVVAWHVDEGARVAAGDELVDIETTKITNVFECPVAGTLCRRVAAAGETVPVGALLAVLAEDSVPADQIEAFVARFAEDFAIRAAEAEAGAVPESVEAGGRRFRYLNLGEGEEAPIVFVHGFGGDLNSWLFNQPALAEHHPTLALDLPGHGGSTKEVGAGDMNVLRGALTAFLEALGVGEAHLVGHSLGGAVALDLALAEPERVRSLTLIAAAALGPEINMDYIEGFIGARRRKELKPVLALIVHDPAAIGREMVDEVLRYKRLDGVEAALSTIAGAAFAGGGQTLRLDHRVPELGAPAQVIWGRDDRIVPPAHAEALEGTLPVHLLEGAGHMVHMEKAAEVNALIAALVDS